MTARRARRPARAAGGAKKQKTKAKPKREEQALEGDLGVEIGGIALSAAAGVGLVSLVRGPAGYVGGALASALLSALGRGAYVVPLIAALTGVLMLWRRTGYVVMVRLAGLAVASLAAVVAFELAAVGGAPLALPFSDYLRNAGFLGGGALGAAGAWVFMRLFGYAGTIVVLCAMGAGGIAVATNVSVASAITWVARTIWSAIWLAIRMVRAAFDAVVLNLFEERPPSPDAPDKMGVAGGKPDDVSPRAPSRPRSAPPADLAAPTVPAPAAMTPADSLPPTDARAVPAPSAAGRAAVRAAAPSVPGADMPDVPLQQLKLIDDSAAGVLPPLSILRAPARRKTARKDTEDPSALGRMLEETLGSFGVDATVVGVSQGPMVTRFEVQPGVGVKVSKIVNLADDLALAFASAGVRIEAPIPGKSAVGIEVPSREKSVVYLREVLDSDEFRGSESRLTMALGKDIAGAPIVADLADMLHLLVAGATGSGKSVCLNSIICSLLFKATPEEVRFLMIDPKRVELSVYDGVPHLLAPVITDPKKASGYLRWVVEEMENRYRLFQIAGARNIAQYNDMVKSGTLEQFLPDQESEADAQVQAQADAVRPRPLSYVVVIVDELADLMMVAQREVEDAIARLAFMARAAGIHLLIATQRPSVDILTGIIKANIPSRIAFAVSSQVDSRIILDTAGAERLLGKGDMLFHPVGLPKPIRVQGAYISDEEVAALVEFVRRRGEPLYEAENVQSSAKASEGIAEDDELFAEAATLVVQTGEASISKIQRRFRVGYARAARLIDTMEVLGIIGPYEGSKPRKVLMDEAELEEALGRRG